MARTIYVENPVQRIEAIQYTGANGTEMVEFDPELIRLSGGQVEIRIPGMAGWGVVNPMDWVMDDPAIGFSTQVTDEAFRVRFNVGGSS